MIAQRLKWSAYGPMTAVIAGILLATPSVRALEDTVKIPPEIMNALNARFPGAEIHQWAKEQEGEIVVYDIEFAQSGGKFEVDITQDGTIHNWEQEIAAQDLPDAVKKVAATKYPASMLKEVMAITAVKDGKDEFEGY